MNYVIPRSLGLDDSRASCALNTTEHAVVARLSDPICSISVASASRVAVFWEGADDDAGRIKGVRYVRASLMAYILLVDELVLHPAYFFQESATRKLLMGNALVDAGPKISLAMGDDSDIGSYILRRIDGLKEFSRDWGTTSDELQQYVKHGDRLYDDCDMLDSRFRSDNGHYKVGFSRDGRFRELIRHELLGHGKLYRLIVYGGGRPKKISTRAIDEILEIVNDERVFVSVDSLVCMLRRCEYPANSLSNITDYLHLLHWGCHSSPCLRTPLAIRETSGKIDPFDPEIFWAAMAALVGKEWVQGALALEWTQACQFAKILRADGTWQHFRAAYIDLVEDIARITKGMDPTTLMKKLHEAYPSRVRMILKNTSKISLVGTLVSLVALSVPIGLLAWLEAVATVVGVGELLWSGIKESGKYDESVRHDLGVALRSALRGAGVETSAQSSINLASSPATLARTPSTPST